jgi:hypothetical protein
VRGGYKARCYGNGASSRVRSERRGEGMEIS